MIRHHAWLWLAALLLLGCPSGDDDDAMGDDDAGDDDAANQPPTAPSVTIEPEEPDQYDDLHCVVVEESTDPDGDTLAYQYEWLRDGDPAGITEELVPAEETAWLEVWTCQVRAFDGTDEGPTAVAAVAIQPTQADGYHIDWTLDVSGGPLDGDALMTATVTFLNSDQNPLCTVVYEFESDYTYGPSQGEDFWTAMDEIVTWTSFQQAASDCPPSWTVFSGNPVDDLRWSTHPFAFVGCEQIAADPGLSATFVGDDPFDQGDGTLGGYCADTGPWAEDLLGTGPVEGVWLSPGTEGFLDGLGDYAYFPPANQSHVEVWALHGLLLADAGNTAEPTPGLLGRYVPFQLWNWIYEDNR